MGESDKRFKVRCIKPSEIGRLAELVRSLQEHQKMAEVPRLPDEHDLMNELVHKTDDGTLMATNNGTFTVVAIDTTKLREPNHKYIIGYLIYTQSFSIIHGRFIYMNSFFIEKNYRRHGLGKKIMEFMQTHAKTTGNNKVDVPFMNNNLVGQKFYAGYGAFLVNEEYVIMGKRIDD